MAANSIGKASLILNTSTGKLSSGLDSAYQMIAGFKNRIQGAFSSFSLGGFGKLAAIGATVFTLDKIKDSIQELAEVGKTADRLGIATEQLMGLSEAAKVAGVGADEFTNLLGKVQAKAGEASADTAAAFAQLGTSVQAMQSMAPDQQFLTIADGIARIPNAAQQAAIATKLFEESGVKLLPMLRQGSEGLREFVAEQQKLGTALGRSDINKAMQANQAMERAGQVFRGTWNKLVIAVAPLVEAIANRLATVFENLRPVIDWVVRAFTAWVEVAMPVIDAIYGGIWDIIVSIADFVADLFGLGGSWGTVGEVITGVLRALGVAAAYVWDVFKAGLGALAYPFSFLIQGLNLMAKGLRELLGIMAELPDDLGGDWALRQYEGMKEFTENVDAKAEQMREWGARQIMGIGNSAADVRKFFDKLKDKPAEVAKATEKAMEQVAAAAAPFKYQGSAALERGSKEEYSARVRFQQESQSQLQKQAEDRRRLEDIQRQALEQLKKISARPIDAGGLQLGIV